MELTPAEERLILTLREIDSANPAGIDDYTERHYLETLQRIVDGVPAEAGRRYRLFLKERKPGRLIDLREAQRSKRRWEDTRATAESKADYEQNWKRWGLHAPIWKPGAPD